MKGNCSVQPTNSVIGLALCFSLKCSTNPLPYGFQSYTLLQVRIAAFFGGKLYQSHKSSCEIQNYFVKEGQSPISLSREGIAMPSIGAWQRGLIFRNLAVSAGKLSCTECQVGLTCPVMGTLTSHLCLHGWPLLVGSRRVGCRDSHNKK